MFDTVDQDKMDFIRGRVDSLAWASAMAISGGGTTSEPLPSQIARAVEYSQRAAGLFELWQKAREGVLSVDEVFALAQSVSVKP